VGPAVSIHDEGARGFSFDAGFQEQDFVGLGAACADNQNRNHEYVNHLDSGARSLPVWESVDQALIDRLCLEAVPPRDHWIGGRSVRSRDGAALAVLSPIDGRVFTTIAAGASHEVDKAVRAARQAHALELAVLGLRDNGTEIGMAYKAEPLSAAAIFRYYAEAVDKSDGEIAPTAPDVLGLVHREPLRAVGVIVPLFTPARFT
jgi:hypothetical protein